MSELVFSADNNKLAVQGYLMNDLSYDHTILSEDFYSSTIAIPRYSDTEDIIPIIVSERLVNTSELVKGTWVRIDGQFRSHNLKVEDSDKSVYKLSIFAQNVSIIDTDDEHIGYNEIVLNGYICKLPRYRTTPSGREITDLYIAINRAKRKSDYLPCISWGRNAKYSETLSVGTHVYITGRVQSREYYKKLDEDNTVLKMCYEVSINTISEIFDDDEKVDTSLEN